MAAFLCKRKFDPPAKTLYYSLVLRISFLAVVAGLALLISGCGEVSQFVDSVSENDGGKTQNEIIVEVEKLGFYPQDDATRKAPERIDGVIVEQEVKVFVGTSKRSPDDPKVAACSAIVAWHQNGPETLLDSEGTYLMEDPTNDGIFDSPDPSLDRFKDCWQP